MAEVHEMRLASVADCFGPKALRAHILRLLGPKTLLYRAFGAMVEP